MLLFMSHIVESEAENYEKRFIVKIRQSLKIYRILKMVRFFLRSVYYRQYSIEMGFSFFVALSWWRSGY